MAAPLGLIRIAPVATGTAGLASFLSAPLPAGPATAAALAAAANAAGVPAGLAAAAIAAALANTPTPAGVTAAQITAIFNASRQRDPAAVQAFINAMVALPVPPRNVPGGLFAFPDLANEFQELFGITTRPGTVKDFIIALSDVNREAIAEQIQDPDDAATHLGGKGAAKLIKVLSGLPGLVALLKALNPTATIVAPYNPPSVNTTAGLNLLLANPLVATVVMQQRKKQTQAALARPVLASGAGPFGPFGAGPGGLSIRMFGGASEALASIDPLNYDPIEMRGAGPMLASMRGGNYVIGTTSSPTQWRPIDDNSFISASLSAAIKQLQASAAQQGSKLEAAVEQNVNALILALQNAEKAVKDERNKINDMNNAIASGSAKHMPGVDTTAGDIQRAADAYNNAMKNRQKIENKLFRVVIALGGKQLYP